MKNESWKTKSRKLPASAAATLSRYEMGVGPTSDAAEPKPSEEPMASGPPTSMVIR